MSSFVAFVLFVGIVSVIFWFKSRNVNEPTVLPKNPGGNGGGGTRDDLPIDEPVPVTPAYTEQIDLNTTASFVVDRETATIEPLPTKRPTKRTVRKSNSKRGGRPPKKK